MADETLRKLYYDLDHPASYSSAERLYQAAKKKILVTRKQVKDFLSGELAFTLHKQVRRNWKRNKILVSTLDEQWQIDLAFMREFSSQNDGYQYILTVIDCFSKFAWAKPLKRKDPDEIIDSFKDIFAYRKPLMIQSDKGKEFDNKTFREFLKKHGIHYFTTNSPKIKCSIIERFNKTLKNRMHRVFTARGTRRWTNILPSLIDSYNKAHHRTIKMAPCDVKEDNVNQVFQNIYGSSSMREYLKKDKKLKLSLDDKVRKAYDNKPFDRAYWPGWTDRTFKVDRLIRSQKIPIYKIKSDKKRRYYSQELQKVKENLFRIEKIVNERMKSGKKEYLCKFIGYDESWNQWIPENDMVNLHE